MAGTLRLTNTGGASGQTTITAVGTTDRTVTTPDEDGTLLIKDPSGNFAVDGDVQMASLNGGPLAGFRNKIINGAMLIWQRSTDVSPTGAVGIATADRWHCQGSGIDQLIQVPANSSQLSGCPQEFPYAFGYWDQIDISTRSSFIQAVEIPFDTRSRGCGPFTPGRQWTLSCYASADITSIQARLDFAEGASDSANTVSYGALANWVEIEAPTATRWGRYAVTFTATNASPDANSTCLRVNFGGIATVQSSSDFTTNTSRFGVTGCQLEPGPVATPFEQRPIGTELALCRRYYIRTTIQVESVSTGGNTPVYHWGMRTTPTVTALSGGAIPYPKNPDFTVMGSSSSAQEATITIDAEL
jgi:hypothetical protein